MTAQKLQQAKELDSNINTEDLIQKLDSQQERIQIDTKPPQYGKPGLSPLILNQKQKSVDQQPSILQVIGNNEYDRARREEAKKMVQNQYNQYLAQQPQRKVGNIYEGDGFLNIGTDASSFKQRANSANRQMPDQPLVISGMQQIGGQQNGGILHRNNPEDERQRRLQEIKATALQNQMMAAAKKEQPVSQEQRRRQIVDQVFDEVVDSARFHRVQPQSQPQSQPAQLPPRQWSGVNKRQADVQKLQNASDEDPFFKQRLRQDEQKRAEQDKKREYAAILNQQMEAKKQRQNSQSGSTTPYQNQTTQFQNYLQPAYLPQQNQAYLPSQIASYQQNQQAQHSDQLKHYNIPTQSPQPNYEMPSQQQIYQVPYTEPRFQSQQRDLNTPQYMYQHYSAHPESQDDQQFFAQKPQLELKHDQIRQQEEYRQDLQRQIELKEQIKRQESFDLPKSIHGGPNVAPQTAQTSLGIRQRTDVTKMPDQFDPVKEQKRLKYQEELKIQMEEQKRRKEDAKKQELETDLEIERKLKRQREIIADREKDEILKEGKRDPREFDDRPKRAVRRDQFQTSDDNNAVTEHQKLQARKVEQERPSIIQAPQFQPAVNFIEPVEPIKKSNIDLFAKADPFQGLEPARQLDLPIPKKSDFNFNMPEINQMAQMQMPIFAQGAQPIYQNQDWALQQREQASKMFDDQQKMIKLYQQALEQILQYRNQYFEQAMQMRENILKEREQLFEYEKLKQAQIAEINQLKAVHGQLGYMMESASKQKQPIMDKSVQQNLNNYISKQKESILSLSRSSAGFAEVISQNRQTLEKQMLGPSNQTPRQDFNIVVKSERVEIPRVTNKVVQYQEEAEDDLQRRVNEIDRHLIGSVENGIYGASNIEDFEKSLNAESKLVRVPQNNLSAKAQRLHDAVQDRPIQGYQDLMQTWTQEEVRRNDRPQSNVSPMRIGRQFQEQSSEKSNKELILNSSSTPKNKLLGKLIGNTSKSPLNSSAIPQTIEELPYENEEDKVLQSSSLRVVNDLSPKKRDSQIINSEARIFSEQDFNNRDSPSERSPQKQTDLQSNLKTIERMVQQQSMMAGQSGFIERKQTTTGSSFYDKTLQNERMKQAHQQEEVQKQMMRIFGNTSQSYHQPSFEPQPIQQNSPINFEQAFMGLNKGLNPNQQKSSTMILRTSNEKLEPGPMKMHEMRRQEPIGTTANLIVKGERSIDNDTWEDPDFVPPPVFPSYIDENSHEMIVENNSSNAGTILDQHRQLQLRSNMVSDEQNYMGGLGMIPDSAFNTLSPPYSRRPIQMASHQEDQDSEEIVDETADQETEQRLEQSPKQSQNGQSMKSSKKLYMDEITALIKKATASTNIALQAAENKRRSPFVPADQYALNTPHFIHNDRAAVTAHDKPGSNDQILADLDKIISNLEAQQKNMQTFGIQVNQIPESDQDYRPEQIEEEPAGSITQSTNRKWKTLKDARDAKRIINEDSDNKMVTIGRTGRAPLDPKSVPRPKSGKSAKSKGSRKGSAAGDPSPQRVGKYAQMALQNTSQSPMRVGKYTNMALQNSPLNAMTDNSASRSPSALKSPQRIGKYAAMALNNSQINRSGISGQSPSRIGKFAQMALNNQREMPDIDNMSQKYSRALSGSRERQKSVDRQTIVQQLENEIDSKLGFDNNENLVNNGQPILRPLSSVSKSSRYNNGTQEGQKINSSLHIAPEFSSKVEQSEVAQTQTKLNFRNTGNIRTDVKIYGNGKPMQVAQYFSDDEDAPMPLQYQNSASGRTELTEKLRKVREPRITQE